jgi:hypothetical protein
MLVVSPLEGPQKRRAQNWDADRNLMFADDRRLAIRRPTKRPTLRPTQNMAGYFKPLK